MTVGEFFALVRSKLAIILLVTVVAGGVAAVFTAVVPTTYTATTSLYVSSQSSNANTTFAYQGGLLSEQKVKSYAQLVTSTRVLSAVDGQLGLSVSTDELASRISVQTQPDTTILNISATSTDPLQASQIADAVAIQFSRLAGELEASAVQNSPPAVTTKIVEPAAVEARSIPGRYLRNIAIGLVLGLALGVGAVVLRRVTDTSIRTVEDLAEITGKPAIGRTTFDPRVNEDHLPVRTGASESLAEQYRQIRTALQFVDVDAKSKVMVVASSGASEGKSTTTCNLALALGQAGASVVVIEADLRRPQLSNYLGLNSDVGLTSVLAGRISLNDALQHVPVEGVDFLSCGPLPPNPSELLGSRQMASLVAELRTKYETVLIDVAPILPVADGIAVAAHCDGLILLARYAKTTKQDLRRTIQTLDLAESNVYGTILTMCPTRGEHGYYGYGYGPDAPQANSSAVKVRPSPLTKDSSSQAFPRPSPRPSGQRERLDAFSRAENANPSTSYGDDATQTQPRFLPRPPSR